MNKPRKGTNRERCWKLMRLMGSYTLTEIATLAEAPYENISHYHQCLVAAGYARQIGTKRQEGRPGTDKLFRLVKNTGPKPPVQKDLRFIFDQNTGEYWCEDPERVAFLLSFPQAQGVGNPSGKKDSGQAGMTEQGIGGITGRIKLGSGVKLLCPRKKNTPHPNPLPQGARESSESPSIEGRGKGRVKDVD